jgi:hypothetical protein
MLFSGLLCCPLGPNVFLWFHMTSSGKICCPPGYPLILYVILWIGMFSGSVCFPLGRYVVLQVRMLSSEPVCYPLSPYVILWIGMFSGSVCYPRGSNCRPAYMFLIIILCYHLMWSSEMITSSFFIIPENLKTETLL